MNNLLMDAYENAVAEVKGNVLEQTDGFMPAQDFPDMDLPTR